MAKPWFKPKRNTHSVLGYALMKVSMFHFCQYLLNEWIYSFLLSMIFDAVHSESESKVAQSCPTLCDPMDCSPPGSSVHGILQQEYWSGLPFPSPGDLPNPGIKPRSPALQADVLPSEPPGKPQEKELKWSEVKSLSHVRLCDPVDCSPPSSSVHGILQARTLEWVAVSFSRGSSWPRDRTQVSHIAGRRFTLWATKEAQYGIPHMWNLNRKDTREHQTQT